LGARWLVEIVGDRADLDMLARSMSGTDPSVTDEGGKFVLGSEAFSKLADARAVSETARAMLSVLSGLVRLTLQGRSSFDVGSIYRLHDDRRRDPIVVVKTEHLEIRSYPPIVIQQRSDGTRVGRSRADDVAGLFGAAGRNLAMSKAMRLRNQANLGWVELYRLLEVVATEIPLADMAANGWTTKAELKRFQHTANSVAAAGDLARHGAETTRPPASPMSLAEAQGLVDKILRHWMIAAAAQSRGGAVDASI